MPSGSAAVALPLSTDVAVIGGGVVGLAVALELARRGVAVTVLERDRIGHGCSFGNAGWLTPSLALPLAAPGMFWKSLRWMFDPESPLYIQPRPDPQLVRWLFGFLGAMRRDRFESGASALVAMCRQSVDMWEKLASEGDDFGFTRHGLVCVYESPKAMDAARYAVELVAGLGVRHERWSADEVRQHEPAVVGAQVGAFCFPDDAHCDPYPATRALAVAAERAGAKVIEDAEVVAVDRGGAGGGVVKLRTTRGEIAVGAVVVAAGAWSGAVGAMLDLRVPILGAKGYSLLLPRLDPHPTRSIYLVERKVAINPSRSNAQTDPTAASAGNLRPLPDGRFRVHDQSGGLRISGTLELVRDDLSINQRRVDAIVRGARAMLPLGQDLVVRELWRGLRPCAPDGMPLIGKARGLGNVWLATGHQMTGLKTAPGSGLLLAELMTGATPSFDPQPFRADRY